MRRFGLIGYPLGHSFSGKYFAEKFSREGISDARYELFPIPSILEFPRLWQDNPGLIGLNVTIPYKSTVLPFLDDQSDVVREIGACNCIIRKEGRLIGHNTDVVGFASTLDRFGELAGYRALVLGTGGASKAVEYVLRQRGIPYRLVSRNPIPEAWNYGGIDASVIGKYLLIINTTPLGMHPNVHDYPKIPYASMGADHILIDLVYNPSLTLFMEKGIARGARVANGEKMLVEQAEESWRIWNA